MICVGKHDKHCYIKDYVIKLLEALFLKALKHALSTFMYGKFQVFSCEMVQPLLVIFGELNKIYV